MTWWSWASFFIGLGAGSVLAGVVGTLVGIVLACPRWPR